MYLTLLRKGKNILRKVATTVRKVRTLSLRYT